VSNAWLTDKLHLSDSTIKRSLKHLSDNNYITLFYDNQDKIKSKRFILVSKSVLSMVSDYTKKSVKIVKREKSKVLRAFLEGNYESC
jgi:DNA-binding MarR family transcriptional regulator